MSYLKIGREKAKWGGREHEIRFFDFYILNQDISLNINFPTMKFHTFIENIYTQGTMSQIFYLVPNLKFKNFWKSSWKNNKILPVFDIKLKLRPISKFWDTVPSRWMFYRGPENFSPLRGFNGHGKNRLKHWMYCRDLSICRESLVVPHLTSNKYYFLIQWLLNKKLLWVKSWRCTFFVLFLGTICTFFHHFLYFFGATSPWQHCVYKPHPIISCTSTFAFHFSMHLSDRKTRL